MSKSNQNFSTVDIFSVATNRQKINTTVSISEMPELASLIINSETVKPFVIEIEGTEGVRGLPAAMLTIEGKVQMRCTRCTQPIDIDIEREVPFLFVKSEAEANRIPVEEDEEWEVVVGSEHMDVAAWVQEEIILSLPNFPRHDDCEAPLKHSDIASEDEEVIERPKPFANLRDLLKKN